MSIHTPIQWADSTANDRSGCDGCELWTVSPTAHGRLCYAGQLQSTRLSKAHPTLYARDFLEVRQIPGRIRKAARWKDLTGTARPDKPWLDGQPHIIFADDMTDPLAGVGGDDEQFWLAWINEELIQPMIYGPGERHMWILCTKKPQRIARVAEHLAGRGIDLAACRNIMWLTSVTGPNTLWRVGELLKAPVAWRGVSAEPLLSGPVDLGPLLRCPECRCGEDELTPAIVAESDAGPWPCGLDESCPCIHWVIAGGASARKRDDAPPCNVDHIHGLIKQGAAAGVPVFVKQLGSRPRPLNLADGHGGDWDEWPDDLRVRQVPDFAAMMQTGGER